MTWCHGTGVEANAPGRRRRAGDVNALTRASNRLKISLQLHNAKNLHERRQRAAGIRACAGGRRRVRLKARSCRCRLNAGLAIRVHCHRTIHDRALRNNRHCWRWARTGFALA